MELLFSDEKLVRGNNAKVQTTVIFWEDILEIIDKNDLKELNPIFADFYKLICNEFVPAPIVFSEKEINMIFSKEMPHGLSNLDGIIRQLVVKSKDYRTEFKQLGKSLLPNESGIYFYNKNNDLIMFFGMWDMVWKEHGFPFCFGVSPHWSGEIQDAFKSICKDTIEVEKWTLGWIKPEVFKSENTTEEIWKVLDPILKIITTASMQE